MRLPPLALLVVGALGCHPPASVPPAAAPPVTPDAPPTPAPSEPGTAATHPGTVVFVDLDTGEESPLPVAEVPESIAWGLVEGRRVAVVRVESRARGGSREIVRYADGGVLVDTTVGGP